MLLSGQLFKNQKPRYRVAQHKREREVRTTRLASWLAEQACFLGRNQRNHHQFVTTAVPPKGTAGISTARLHGKFLRASSAHPEKRVGPEQQIFRDRPTLPDHDPRPSKARMIIIDVGLPRPLRALTLNHSPDYLRTATIPQPPRPRLRGP